MKTYYRYDRATNSINQYQEQWGPVYFPVELPDRLVRTIPVSGPHKWIDGQEVREGQDFYVWWLAKPPVAVPITQESEEELWAEMLKHFGIVAFAPDYLNEVRESFTLTRK